MSTPPRPNKGLISTGSDDSFQCKKSTRGRHRGHALAGARPIALVATVKVNSTRLSCRDYLLGRRPLSAVAKYIGSGVFRTGARRRASGNRSKERGRAHRLAPNRRASICAKGRCCSCQQGEGPCRGSSPRTLADLRDAFHADVKACVVAEIHKDLTKHPVWEIEKHLMSDA